MKTAAKGITLATGFVLLALGSVSAQQPGKGTATVTVENTRAAPVMVYLERGMFDIRLGRVAPHSQQTLPLPSTLEDGEQIQIVMHPAGGVDLTTGDFSVKLGATIDVLVPANDVGYVAPPPPETIPNPGAGTTTITVQNNRAVPVTVFVERGDFDTRIGTVPANQELTLMVPEWLAREKPSAQIFVHPEGEGDLESWTLDLAPGAHLFVKVPTGGR